MTKRLYLLHHYNKRDITFAKVCHFLKNSQPKLRLSLSAPDFQACRGFICATFCNFAVRIRKKTR